MWWNKNKILLLNISILVLLFAGSVFVRRINFDQPPGRHHEYITGHVLMTCQAWDQGGGPANYHFAPVYTYKNNGDKYVGVLGGVVDKKGDCYYISYPPLAFIAPYYALKIFSMPYTFRSIQIWGIGLHFFTALLFFVLLLRITRQNIRQQFQFAALLGFGIYLFLPGNLWFHSNVYFADVLMQLLFVVQILFFYQIWMNPYAIKTKTLLIVGFINFLAIYTEWLGLLCAFCFSLFIIILWIRRKKRIYFFILLTIGLSTLLCLALILMQYSAINGWEACISVMKDKYIIRSGTQSLAEKPEFHFNLFNKESYTLFNLHFVQNYGPAIWLFLTTVIAWIILCFYTKTSGFSKPQWFVLAFLFFPVLLHHLIFFNFNIEHDFSSLKISFLPIAFASFTAFNYSRLFKMIFPFTVSLVVFFLLVRSSVQDYSKVNSPLPPDTTPTKLAAMITKYAQPNDMVFTNWFTNPPAMALSQRNYSSFSTIHQAILRMNSDSYLEGIFIKIGDNDVQSVYRINNKGDSLLVYPR